MHLRVPKLGGLALGVSVQDKHQPISDEGPAEVVFRLTKATDGVLRVGFCLVIVADDIQELSFACRTRFLSSTNDMESSGKPVAGLLARQLTGRAEWPGNCFAVPLPRANVVTQLLDFRSRLWPIIRFPKGKAG